MIGPLLVDACYLSLHVMQEVLATEGVQTAGTGEGMALTDQTTRQPIVLTKGGLLHLMVAPPLACCCYTLNIHNSCLHKAILCIR